MLFVLYQRHNSARAAIIDDLLALADSNQHDAVSTAVHMLSSLYLEGRNSSYAQKLQGLPIWELKSHSRGGAKGGTRIYFYFRSNGNPVIVNAEIKSGNSPNGALLKEATSVALQDKQRR